MKRRHKWQESLRHIYFHADFDGAVSAAMLLRWSRAPDRITLHPVDYHLKASWAQLRLPPCSAVVDFLYHPDAYFWIDHHSNPFVRPEWGEHFQPTETKRWKDGAPCCPTVLQESFGEVESLGHFKEYIAWSVIIDSGSYASPEDATDINNPYLLASRAILLAQEDVQIKFPLLMASHPLEEVLNHESSIVALVECVRQIDRHAKERLVDMLNFDGNVVLYDQSEHAWPYQRYHPYLVYPDAGFVVGIYAKKVGFEVSLGSNPWKPKPVFHIGKICEAFGGGGHAQVGGVAAKDVVEARRIAEDLRRAVKIELER